VINRIGWSIIEQIKQVHVSQGLKSRTLGYGFLIEYGYLLQGHWFDKEESQCNFRGCNPVKEEKTRWYGELFLPQYFVSHPFVTMPRACISILDGQVMVFVTRSGKLNMYTSKGIKKIAEHTLAVGVNDKEESGIPDKSDDESDE